MNNAILCHIYIGRSTAFPNSKIDKDFKIQYIKQ